MGQLMEPDYVVGCNTMDSGRRLDLAAGHVVRGSEPVNASIAFAGAGPIPRQVADPAAATVLPASFTRCAGRPVSCPNREQLFELFPVRRVEDDLGVIVESSQNRTLRL